MAEQRRDPIDQAKGDSGRGWRFYAASALAVLALIFVIQNTDKTSVNFLFSTTELPLFLALIFAILLGALIGWLAPRVRRTERPPKS